MPIALSPPRDRRFDTLVAEARRRIPRLAPAWTDHNYHDPGITLIDLLAWLTESDVYRAGRIGAATQRAFLRWFGIELGGPTVAETVVALSAAAPVRVTADTVVRSPDRATIFTTAEPITVQAAALTGATVFTRAAGTTRVALDGTSRPAPVFGMAPAPGDWVRLDASAHLSGEVQLYFWSGAPDHDAAIKRALRKAPPVPGGGSPEDQPYPLVRVVWEALAPGAAWTAVEVRRDRTRSLTLSGTVLLNLAAPTRALRVRLASGHYDDPPRVAAILLNAVTARHLGPRRRRRAGDSDGRAGQLHLVPGTPLGGDDTEIVVKPRGEPAETWTAFRFWDRAGPHDRVAVLDPESGSLRFGDGKRGAVPPAGARISVRTRTGGGPAGNVPAGTLQETSTPGVTAGQPFAASGGAPAEALEDGRTRLLDGLARATRAVTDADLVALAFATPGVKVGAARIAPNLHPRFPELPASDCVTVVIVPDAPGPRPTPSRGMLQAVRRHLEVHRPLCTEIHVIGPNYIQVGVRANVTLATGVGPVVLRARAQATLSDYFHPLHGGPERRGWPAGRDVYRSEVYALLQKLPGVEHVADLELLVGDEQQPTCGNVRLCAGDLVAAGPVTLQFQERSRA